MDGVVRFDEASQQTYTSGPWVNDISLCDLFTSHCPATNVTVGCGSKLHSRILRGVEALQATRLHSSMANHNRTVLLSSGGPGTGSFFTTIPSRPDYFMDNEHFRIALNMRLGIMEAPPGTVCQVPRSTDVTSFPELCLQSLDNCLVHPLLCKAGPARYRRHRALAETYGRCARDAGAHVDLERACPELYSKDSQGNVKEAILDVVHHLPGGPWQRKIDVTIRCPFASLEGDACVTPGLAARHGEEDKRRRYGSSVFCLAFESFGRLGYLSLANLKLLAADFEHRTHFKKPSRRLCSRWRLSLERSLLYELADIVALSLGCSSGLHRRRLRSGNRGAGGNEG